MTKLKTLKDLKFLFNDLQIEELRKEAIKWCNRINKETEKAFKDNEDGGDEPLQLFKSYNGNDDGIVENYWHIEDFIIHFFNLTEEDLK